MCTGRMCGLWGEEGRWGRWGGWGRLCVLLPASIGCYIAVSDKEVDCLPSNISGSVPLGLAASPAHVSFPKNKKLPLNSTCSPIQIAAASNEHAVRRNSSHGVWSRNTTTYMWLLVAIKRRNYIIRVHVRGGGNLWEDSKMVRGDVKWGGLTFVLSGPI